MDASLTELIKSGFGVAEDYNCAEKIVRGANTAYGLGLSDDALRMIGGFGGGMGLGETCGTITGAVAVISDILVSERAHATPELKPATQRFIKEFRQELGDLDCLPLRSQYRNKEKGCDKIIITAAEILDELVRDLEDKEKTS